MIASRSHHPGYALVAVLIVVAVLSLVAYQFTDAMTAEYVAAARTTEVAQARLNAVSGVHYTAALLTDAASTGVDPYDSTDLANVPVASSENLRKDARFALVAVGGDSYSGYSVRNGVTDEGGKLNINALIQLDSSGRLLHDALMALPNMTEDVADAIVDWVDPDDTERTAGAESGYYLGLPQPYRAKNGPMNSLDELLLIRGVTWQLLYGTDRNRNGIADDGSGTLDRGWAEYLTVYGRELNSTQDGATRLYLGESDDLPGFHDKLVSAVGQEMADYLLAYKMFDVSRVSTSASPTSTSSSSSSSSTVQGTPDQLSQAVSDTLAKSPKNRRRLRSVLSLVGTQVTLPAAQPASGSSGSSSRSSSSPSSSGGRGGSSSSGNSSNNATPAPPKIVVPCPLNDPTKLKEILPGLLDATTGRQDYEMVPRINVLTAPREVLLGLMAITKSSRSGRQRNENEVLNEQDIDAMISARDGLSATDPDVQTGAWVVTEAGVSPTKFARLERYITGRSMVYRVQSIGYFGEGGPVARVEAVIDTHQGTPRVLYFRDLTELDVPRGFTPPR